MSSESQHEEQLAQFTDRLLQGDRAGSPKTSDDPELAQLENTLMRLHNGLGRKSPDPQMSERIRKNLSRTWQEAGYSRPPERKPTSQPFRWPWQRGWSSSAGRQRAMTLAFSMLALALIVISLVASPAINQAMPATAEIPAPVAVLLVIVGVVALLAALWWSRDHK